MWSGSSVWIGVCECVESRTMYAEIYTVLACTHSQSEAPLIRVRVNQRVHDSDWAVNVVVLEGERDGHEDKVEQEHADTEPLVHFPVEAHD